MASEVTASPSTSSRGVRFTLSPAARSTRSMSMTSPTATLCWRPPLRTIAYTPDLLSFASAWLSRWTTDVPRGTGLLARPKARTEGLGYSGQRNAGQTSRYHLVVPDVVVRSRSRRRYVRADGPAVSMVSLRCSPSNSARQPGRSTGNSGATADHGPAGTSTLADPWPGQTVINAPSPAVSVGASRSASRAGSPSGQPGAGRWRSEPVRPCARPPPDGRG